MKHRVLLSLALLGLAACGSDPDAESAAAAAAPSAAPVPATAPKPEDPSAKMARAVGNGKPGAAVDIRYEFAAKPEVGKPLELRIALVPNAGVDAMNATFSGMQGITVAGELSASFSNVEPRTPYMHTISVLPERAGVFYITVSVDTEISGSTLGRTFSIPFVVGDVKAQQKPAPKTDASGQAIQPMKAQETTG